MKKQTWWAILGLAALPSGLLFLGDSDKVDAPSAPTTTIKVTPGVEDENTGVDDWWAARARDDAAEKAAATMNEDGE